MENNTLPDLILVDGGKGQVNAALSVIKDLELDILVAGMKKNDKHEFESIIFENNEYKLDKTSNLFKLFSKINVEVHRYVITFHRQVRLRETFKSPLDGIRGIGPKRKEALLSYFGTVEAIKNGTEEEFLHLGINQSLMQKVKEELK
ncbi:MAG: hypothetical protein GX232_01680 [Acholeplasmataceae bacterium]|nr:hypothetical protein [Acholeplasmataceae bacterium]